MDCDWKFESFLIVFDQIQMPLDAIQKHHVWWNGTTAVVDANNKRCYTCDWKYNQTEKSASRHLKIVKYYLLPPNYCKMYSKYSQLT